MQPFLSLTKDTTVQTDHGFPVLAIDAMCRALGVMATCPGTIVPIPLSAF